MRGCVFNYSTMLLLLILLLISFFFLTEISGTLSPFAQDAASIASSIKYHAEFSPSFSPDRFELPKAFFATAQSVRDTLIINWNATYDYYNKLNMKQAYYLSMEFLQVCHWVCFWFYKALLTANKRKSSLHGFTNAGQSIAKCNW